MLRYDDFFTGREAQVEQTSAVLCRAIEVPDTNFAVERNRSQRSCRSRNSFEMKTTIIFNFHNSRNMPEVPPERK